MSQEQLREVEQARAQARLSAEKFEKVRQATEPRREVPKAPPGPPAEFRIPQSRVLPEHLQRKQEPLPKQKPAVVTRFRVRTVRQPRPSRPRRASRRGTFPLFFRSKVGGSAPPNRPDSPANIDPSEKTSAIERLDLAIARENRKYTAEIVNGGTDQKKQRTRQKIQQLENEKRAIQNMKPKGRPRFNLAFWLGSSRVGTLGHVKRAEQE